MKRYILVDVRISKDKETNDNLLFMKMYRLASAMKNGGLWHPKDSEALCNVCINQTKQPEEYEKYSKVNPGALFDITFGINDFNNKSFVATCVLVPGSNVHKSTDTYI